MVFSVWDEDRKIYYYYQSASPYRVRVEEDYSQEAFEPWSDAKIIMPEDAKPIGIGETPKGIVAFNSSYQPTEEKSCEGESDIMWLAFLTAANWFIFGR